MPALPRPAGGVTGASALDVNDDGQVVGVGYTSDGGVSTAHAVLWSH